MTADSCSNARDVVPATARASVVLPVPGGPHSSTDDRRSCSTRRRSGRPRPSSCGWPTTSSIVRGRSRAASGACAAQPLVGRRAEEVRRHGDRGTQLRSAVRPSPERHDVVEQPRRLDPSPRPELPAVRRRLDVVGAGVEEEPAVDLAQPGARADDVGRPLVQQPVRVLAAQLDVGRAEAGLLAELAPGGVDRWLAPSPARPGGAASCRATSARSNAMHQPSARRTTATTPARKCRLPMPSTLPTHAAWVGSVPAPGRTRVPDHASSRRRDGRASGHLRGAPGRLLDIRLLGPITAERDGEPVSLGGPRQRAVLARLALVARPRRDRRPTGRRRAGPATRRRRPSTRCRATSPCCAGRSATPRLLRREGPGYVLAVDRDVLDATRFEDRVAAAAARSAAIRTPRSTASTPRSASGAGRSWPTSPTRSGPAPAAVRWEELRLAALETRFDALLGARAPRRGGGRAGTGARRAPAARGVRPAADDGPVPLGSAGRCAAGLHPDADGAGRRAGPRSVASARRAADGDPQPRPAAPRAGRAAGAAPRRAPTGRRPRGARPRQPASHRARRRRRRCHSPARPCGPARTAFVGRERPARPCSTSAGRRSIAGRPPPRAAGRRGRRRQVAAGRPIRRRRRTGMGAIVLWGRATPEAIVPFEPMVEAAAHRAAHRVRRRPAGGWPPIVACSPLLLPELDHLVPGVRARAPRPERRALPAVRDRRRAARTASPSSIPC